MTENARDLVQTATRVCRWPGCINVLEWGGVGRPPSWCLQVVEGVRHTAVNAHRSRLDRPEALAGSTPALGGDDDRPVSRARGELARVAEAVGAGLALWRSETAAHETRMRALVDAAEAALTDLDKDAVDAETAAVRRAAAAAVDRAEQDRDDAAGLQAAAEEARDTALEAADEAVAEAAQAVEQTTMLAGERDAAVADAASLRDLHETALQDLAAAGVRLQALTDELTDARAQRDSSLAAESRVQALLVQVTDERDQARTQRETDVADHRAEMLTIRAEHQAQRDAALADHRDELAAVRTEHAQSLEDLRGVLDQVRAAHAEQVQELRERLDEAAEARKAEGLQARDRLAETRADLTQVRQEADAARTQFREDLAALRAQQAAALDALHAAGPGSTAAGRKKAAPPTT